MSNHDIMDFVDLETEQAVLGLLIINNTALFEAAFEATDFFYPLHGTLAQRMQDLFSEKQSFDVRDFANFQHPDLPEGETTLGYLQRCAQTVQLTASSQAQSYAHHLKELKRKRTILNLIEDASESLKSQRADEVMHTLMDFSTDAIDTRSVVGSNSVFMGIQDSLDHPKEHWATGIAPLDKTMSGGLFSGYTYGIAGGEKMGKTTLAHTISYNLGFSGCKHLYVAMEMGAQQIESRNVARQLEINSLAFLRGESNLKQKIKAATPTPNVYYLDAPGSAFSEIIREVTITKLRHNITGFIVDYWQLVEGRERGENEEAHLRRVAQGFANYARRNDMWCILLAQLNKEGQLFGSNGLKKACDQLYFIRSTPRVPSGRWLEMEASRYTPQTHIGDEECPGLILNKTHGPHFTAA